MKKRLSILVMGLATLLTVTPTFAAIHSFTGDLVNPFIRDDYSDIEIPKFEGWYYIQKETPSVTIEGLTSEGGTKTDAEYFKSDFLFAKLVYGASTNLDSEFYATGSYLFDNQTFLGVSLGAFPFRDTTAMQLTLSPGYRYGLPHKSGYIAASVDCSATDMYYDSFGVIDIELAGRYYTKKSRLYGQVIVPNERVYGTTDPYLHFGGALKLSKQIVGGANWIMENGASVYDVGCSANFAPYGVEVRYQGTAENYAIDCNFLYSFTPKLRAGIEAIKAGDIGAPYLSAKLKYTISPKRSLIFIQELENTEADQSDNVSYIRLNFAL